MTTATTSHRIAPSVPCTYVRGGSSKACFFHEADLPAEGPARDKLIIRFLGSPDASQIDGMGGTRVVTSKASILRPSRQPDADIDYTFCQISIDHPEVFYGGNCGNISAAVGPFAINEGIIKREEFDSEGRRVVRIYNTGTKAVLVAHVPIDKATGRALEKGDFSINGVPGTGAPILMDYGRTATPDRLLPTGNVIDRIECSFGVVEGTCCAVGNMMVMVRAEDLGATGSETFAQLDSNKALIAKVDEVRGRVAQKLGRCDDWTKCDEQSGMLPLVVLASKATTPGDHIQVRLFLDHHLHPALAGTASVCITATSRMKGSIINQLLSPDALGSNTLNIQHPMGHFPVAVKTRAPVSESLPDFEVVGFERTARYLFQGNLFVPWDVQDMFDETMNKN